ncbi:heme-degrading domain-containing protein [Acidipila sp. EB88]|uniref:heme-degrading domain-containing protein n=1 Tax=Acidipila sp. EB88 TaxID=2305226 RepID=UPI000F60130F|nr:heme-degrading domain-containing protein [Acidipila sp. EB88]RRA48340.1 heme-degrading domain-containing protein [Acidipila sp. EB88]
MGIAEDLERIARQERELVFARFDWDTAWRLGSWLRAAGAQDGLPIVVEVRRFEQPLFYAALAGTTPDNADWVRRKVNTVTKFARSSYAIGLELKAKDTDLMAKYALPERDYAAHGGCFPIRVAGAGMIGTVTVSGLPQREDHALVVRALCAELGLGYGELGLAE